MRNGNGRDQVHHQALGLILVTGTSTVTSRTVPRIKTGDDSSREYIENVIDDANYLRYVLFGCLEIGTSNG